MEKKTLLIYSREGSDLELYLVIPQKELEERPELLAPTGITPEIIQEMQRRAGIKEVTPKKELEANRALFGTTENRVELQEIVKDTEEEPMSEKDLDERLRQVKEEGLEILAPEWYPKDPSVWDETPVDAQMQ